MHMHVNDIMHTASWPSLAVKSIHFDMNGLKKARLEAGLTQTQLSEMSGVSQAMISRIEKGYDGASLRTIAVLARHLKKEPYELYDLPELHARAIRALEDLSSDPDRQAAAIVVLESMSGSKS
ncbi:helix-turn-helix domain-containing protein [Aestuariibius sp. 2305UL40-4]|uniref:helix-turn-helix domain-containing protein n=1 Tax=Aestuariibius violaceus TaxID=3234132 RepID=UPI00345E5206